MKKKVLAMAALALCASGAALAQSSASEGNFMVRARGVYLESVNNDDTGLNLSINNKWVPEVDFSYFFTKNIAAELILTYPQKQRLYANGAEIGSFKHLPPTLLVQYHFDLPGVKPYVGVGLNYTHISNVDLPAGVDVKRNSFGPAFQVGVDIPVAKNLYINLDVKKTYIQTDVSAGGAKIGTLKLDPWLLGVGVGYRF